MLRVSRLTDYGTMILGCLAQGDEQSLSAKRIAQATGLRMPTAQKLLKQLAGGDWCVPSAVLPGATALRGLPERSMPWRFLRRWKDRWRLRNAATPRDNASLSCFAR